MTVAPKAAVTSPGTEAVTGRHRRRLATRVLTAAVAVALLVVTATRVDLGAALAALRGTAFVAIAVAVALGVPVVAARTLRTAQLLRASGAWLSLGRITSTQLVGLTLSGLTPGGTGDLVRAFAWRADGIPVETGLVVVAIERIASLLLLIGVGLVCIAPTVDAPLGSVLLIAGIIAAALPWLVARLPVSVLGNGEAGGPLRRRLLGTALQARLLLRSGRIAAGLIVATLVAFALSGAQIAVIAAGTHGRVATGGAIAVYCLGQAAGSLSALPFGLGATEAVMVALLVHLGEAAPQAGAVALLSRLTVTLPQTLVAAGLLLGGGVKRRRQPEKPAGESR